MTSCCCLGRTLPFAGRSLCEYAACELSRSAFELNNRLAKVPFESKRSFCISLEHSGVHTDSTAQDRAPKHLPPYRELVTRPNLRCKRFVDLTSLRLHLCSGYSKTKRGSHSQGQPTLTDCFMQVSTRE